MGLTQQREKLDTAQKYLLDYPVHSQEFEAAAEHLRWAWDNQEVWRPRIKNIIELVIENRSEPGVITKLMDIFVTNK